MAYILLKEIDSSSRGQREKSTQAVCSAESKQLWPAKLRSHADAWWQYKSVCRKRGWVCGFWMHASAIPLAKSPLREAELLQRLPRAESCSCVHKVLVLILHNLGKDLGAAVSPAQCLRWTFPKQNLLIWREIIHVFFMIIFQHAQVYSLPFTALLPL